MQHRYERGGILARGYLQKTAVGRTVEFNKLKRQKQYRHEREQSELTDICRKPSKGRTVEINKLKRLMQYGSVRGAI